jgi:hypothetical protein|tara:strand:- start:943 stop:1440 length:498 start_codon:yes stop_codon:yes gene_type:complete
MPSVKTKKLLEGLGKITDSAPKPFAQQKYHSYTNRFYPNTIHPLPVKYDKAKRKKDEDGDEYIMIDRVYGSLYDDHLLQKDGTTYLGKLFKKRRLVVRKDPITGEKKNFYSPCTSTADGRWFDNTGLPIEAPDKLEPEKVKTQEEIQEEKRQAAQKEARIIANLK